MSLFPHVSHTYAPIGQTPAITISTEVGQRLYVASAITPKGELIYHLEKKHFSSKTIILFLRQILQTWGRKIILIWDSASIHISQEIRQFLTTLEHSHALFLVQQPKYSPELNADEQVWSYLKRVELKNTCIRNIKELEPRIRIAMDKIKARPDLIRKFFHHPDLGFI